MLRCLTLPTMALARCRLLVFAFVLCTSAAEPEPAAGGARRPKLFYVSSSTTTTTVTSHTLCFMKISPTYPMANCGGKRKRSAILRDASEVEDISPSQAATSAALKEPGLEGDRDAKFLNYWMTTTTTVTSISYTATSTVGSIICTYPNFNYLTCG